MDGLDDLRLRENKQDCLVSLIRDMTPESSTNNVKDLLYCHVQVNSSLRLKIYAPSSLLIWNVLWEQSLALLFLQIYIKYCMKETDDKIDK